MGNGPISVWFGQGHREPNPVHVPGRAKSPEDPNQMQRKRTGPRAPETQISLVSCCGLAKSTGNKTQCLCQGWPSPRKTQGKCTEEAHRTQSAPDANCQDRGGEGLWPGAHGTDPVPMPRRSQVPLPPRRQRNAGEAHRAQSAPRGALRGEIRGNHLGEGLGKLGICRR